MGKPLALHPMKTKFLSALCFVILATWGNATEPFLDPTDRLIPAQVENLVGPIALYPDALVALVLPATTRPSDIVLAARFLERGGKAAATITMTWEDSVKALVHYPEVLAFLDENLGWTQELGEAYLDQPEDVMDAIQTLRDRALKAGLLTDNAQHNVIVEDGEIRIVPAQPTVIYVPRYDPEVLYVTRTRSYHSGPFISFGLGYGIGSWLSHDCHWRHRTVVVVHRSPGWYHRPVWHTRPVFHDASFNHWRPWTPAPHVVRRHAHHSNRHGSVPSYHPERSRVSGAPAYPSSNRSAPERRRPVAVALPPSSLTSAAPVITENRSRPANVNPGQTTRNTSRWQERNRADHPARVTEAAPMRESRPQPVGEVRRQERDHTPRQDVAAQNRPVQEHQRIARAAPPTTRPGHTARPERAAHPEPVTRTESSDDRNPLREAH